MSSSDLSNFEEKTKFNFIWSINYVFTIVGFIMTVFTYLIDDSFFIFYLIVLFINFFGLFALKYFKIYKVIAHILYFSVTIIMALAIFTVPESLHLQESLWMVVIVLSAFFTLGNLTGIFYLIVNTVFFVIYYNVTFPGTAYLSLTIKPEALLVLSIEFGISMFLIGYIMYRFGLINKHARDAANSAYEELKEEKRIVEYQNTEKTVLLQEIHHRVKNNMQVIVSLLRLQSGEIKSEEARQSFEEAITRILTMSLIHQKMYEKESLINLDVKDYLNTLVNNLINTGLIDKEIDFNVESTLSFVSSTTIVPLGLIISELVSNSMKHAFKHSGKITLQVSPADEEYFNMIYADDGKWKGGSSNTFGTQLIEIFVDQLEGEFRREIKDEGTFYYFKLKNLEKDE